MRSLKSKRLTLCKHCDDCIIECPSYFCTVCSYKNEWPFWFRVLGLVDRIATSAITAFITAVIFNLLF